MYFYLVIHQVHFDQKDVGESWFHCGK